MSTLVNNNYFFNYVESEEIYELLELYSKRGLRRRTIHELLGQHCVIFESLIYNKDSESNHEDLIDAGYVLGRVQGQCGGNIIAIIVDNFKYFFVGLENEIFAHLKHTFKKHLNERYIPISKVETDK